MKSNNQYTDLKIRHHQEFNEFPMIFAFDKNQFEKGMKELGLNPEDTDKVCEIRGTGGFYRKSDAERLRELFDRQAAERKAALDGDAKGTGYIYEMFLCELSAHEYTWTRNIRETLECLDLTQADIDADKRLQRGLKKAIDELNRNEVFA